MKSLGFFMILLTSLLEVNCEKELCGVHHACVPKSNCKQKYVDDPEHYSCGIKHPDYVCCPSHRESGGKSGSYGKGDPYRRGGSSNYGGSDRYGGLKSYGGSHRYGGSKSYGSSNRYGASNGYGSSDGGYGGSSSYGGYGGSSGYGGHGGSSGYGGHGGSSGYGGYGGSSGYGGYGGSSGYGGSDKYGGSNSYGSSRHDPHYMDFYHDQYEKYFGYTLSKQAKELLRNYRAKEECGVRNQSPADMARISSGYLHDFGFTSYGEFRWHVALLVKQRRYTGSSQAVYRYHCGATLIHKSLLITAAHCVKGIHPRKLLAHLGDWNLQGSTGELFPAIKRTISRVFIHSGYNPGTYLNDIALLQMYEPINTYKTPHIGPICLPEVNYILKDHSKCFIVGWGDDIYKPNFGSNILKSASVTYASDKECSNRLYASLHHVDDDFVLDTDSQKCVLGAYGKDACVGDGGGGVVCPLSNDEGPDVCNTANCASEHYFLFGVISYGSPVCGEDSVTIITDIVENLNWIYTLLEPAGGLKNYNYRYYEKSRGRSAEDIKVEVNGTAT